MIDGVILAMVVWCCYFATAAPTFSLPTSYPTSSPSTQPSLYVPHLLGFDFDLSVGNLTMYFDHIMEVKSFNYSLMQLQPYADLNNNPVSNSSVTVKLSGVYNNLSKQGNSTTAVILMNSLDYALLRIQPVLANSSSHLFLSLQGGAIRSAFGADIQAVSENDAIPCGVFKDDTLPPFLSSYRINMNLGRLEITFSEPVNVTSFTIDGLALQRSRNAKVTAAETDQYYEFFVDSDTEIVEVSNFNRTLEVSLGFQNMNAIKRAVGLAVTRETTFLSAWKPFVTDLAGNLISLVAFDKLNGIPPAEFQGDYTSPYLRYWDYDANHATISLYFSETIYFQFFNFSGIQLSNGSNAFFRVHNPVNVTPHHDFDIVRFTLGEEQKCVLESMGNVFTQPSNTFIILDQGMVVDTAYTQNVYSSNLATELNPMGVRLFQYDHIRPRLVSCELDLKHGLMSLKFSKSIKLASLKLWLLSVQSTENQGLDTEIHHFQWNDIELLTTQNGIYLEFLLKPQLLVKMRAFSYLGKSDEYTYVVALREFITDNSFLENQLVDVPTNKALKVSLLIPDETLPTLVDWSINLSSNLVVFNFSKPIEMDTLQLSHAMLTSDDRLIPTSKSFTLGGSDIVTSSAKTTSLVLHLSKVDQMTIKSSLGFCNSNSTCFLSVSTDFVKSLRNLSESSEGKRRKDYNRIVPVAFMPPSAFVADSISPKVVHFSLDLDNLALNLEFSKPVILEKANLSQFILSYTSSLVWDSEQTTIDNAIGQSNSTSLSEFCVIDGIVNTTMTILLSPQVYRNIQMLGPLGHSTVTTFLYIGAYAITDVAGNFMDASIKKADRIYGDFTPPQLLGVYLHPSLDNMTVYMTEAVNVSSVVGSSFRMISLSGFQTDLSGCDIEVPNRQHSLISSLFIMDLMPIRAKLTSYKIATGQATTFLFMSGGKMPVDSSPRANRAVVMNSGAAINDGVQFTSFHLNMDEGFILLEMSFYIELVSFSPPSFIIRASDFSASYGLSSISSYELLQSGPGLRIYLSDRDKSRIQQYIPLNSKDSFKILILSTAVTDINGKRLSKSANLPCSYLVNDRSPPYLVSYILNLAQGNIVLTFNKEIVIDSLDLDGTISLVDSRSNMTSSYVIRNPPRAKSSYLTREVILDLNVGYPVTERERVLMKYPLGINVNHTFLTMVKGIAYDNSFPPNPCEPIYNDAAMQPIALYYDASSPSLTGFDVQLSDRILLLNFSEAIDVSSLKMNRFTLANSRDISRATYYTLTSSSKPIDYSPSCFVKVQLSDFDMNQMMYAAPRLLTSAEKSFISVDLWAFKDLAKKQSSGTGNDNNPTYFRYGLSVTRYFEDFVPPKLLSYNISIPSGIMMMKFNEIVNCDSLQTEGIRFQPFQFLGRRPKRKVGLDGSRFSSVYVDDEESYTVSLSNESYCEVENRQIYDTELKVIISYQDMVRIKSTFLVLKAANSTFLTLKENTFRDAFGNGNQALGDVDAMSVLEFIPDTTSPKLLAFSLTSTHMMTLYFNEPVNYRSLDLTRIYFQDGKVGSTHSGYHLQKAKLYGTDTYKMILEVELLYDFFRMQISSFLFKSQYQTNIHVPSITIQDLSKNHLVDIPETYALTVGPRVIFWDLNLDDGYVLLEFSEVVETSFTLLGFTLQNRGSFSMVDENVTSFAFTSSAINAEHLGNRFYKMEMSSNDLYSLKLSSVLTIPRTSSVGLRSALYRQYPLFLTMRRNMTISNAPEALFPGSENLAILSTDALPIRYFVPDVSSPICSMFDLDLNSGTLLLYFDEPIDTSKLSLEGLTLFSTTEGNFVTLGRDYDFVYNASDPYETKSLVQLSSQKNVEVSLSLRDLNSIKLAVLRSNTTALDGLVMAPNSCLDISGNGNIGNDADHPIYINDFIKDMTPPDLIDYQIDERTYIFTLLFDEVVDPTDLMVGDIVLMSSVVNLTHPNQTLSYTLTNYTLVNQSDVNSLISYQYAKRTVLLDLGFLRFDEFQIESKHPSLQRNLSQSFLYLPKMKDIFGNKIVTPTIKQVDKFLTNSRAVVLESFDLSDSDHSGYKLLTLYFARAMDVSTIDCSEFILAESRSSSINIISLTTSDCTVRTKTNLREVKIDLPYSLFSSSSIGSSSSATFLYTLSSMSLCQDIYGNFIEPIASSAALQVGPQIVKVSIDLNNGNLLMVFSKEISLSSAFGNSSSVGFYSSLTKGKVYLGSNYDVYGYSNVASEYYLTTANSYRQNDSVVYLQLTNEDLSRVKLLDVSPGSFFFLLEGNACSDVNGIGNVAKTMNSRLFVTRIIPDIKVPKILNITLNIGSELMMIEFDEPMRVNSFKVGNIRVQSHAIVDIETTDTYIYTNSSSQSHEETRVSYRLTGGTISQSLNTLIIVFNSADANSLKLNSHFVKNVSNTFISIEYKAGTDLSGNYLESIPSNDARAVDTFIPDTSRPELLGFTLDLNHPDGTNYLTLKFNEPMKVTTLNITDITVQSRFAQRDGVFYKLTGGYLRNSDSDTIVIELLSIDVLNMKLTPGLIRKKQSTYLIYSENMVTDLFGNKVLPEVDGYAFACTTFVADTNPPEIVYAKINMTEESITFTMNEPTVLGTIDVTKLSVQSKPGEIVGSNEESTISSPDIDFIRYTISNQSSVIITSTLSTEFKIQLAPQDIDSLKSLYPMTKDIHTTWFQINSNFLFDFVGNSIKTIFPRAPHRADVFVEDEIRPEVLKYELDMNSHKLSLVFSEAVFKESLNLSEIVIQSASTRRFGSSIALTNCSFSVGVLGRSKRVEIDVDHATMVFMKYHGIGSAIDSSWLAYSDVFVLDYRRNRLMPAWDGSVIGFKPKIPDVIHVDSQGPAILRWYIDRSRLLTKLEAEVVMYFDEPVTIMHPSRLYVTSSTPKSQNYPLVSPSMETEAMKNIHYSSLSTEVRMILRDYCLVNTLPGEACKSTFFSYISAMKTDQHSRYGLLVGSQSIIDYARVANGIDEVAMKFFMLKEDGPDCSECSVGSFVQVNCTTNSDRVCSSCSTCKDQYFEFLSCESFRDRSCAPCSSCRYGEYISEHCTIEKDTVCSPCTRCGTMTYAEKECSLGVDAICNSCEQCTFGSKKAQEACERFPAYSKWRNQNCCYDALLKIIPCKNKLNYSYKQHSAQL